MDQMEVNNALSLCGTVSESPAYSHSSRGLDFYSFPLTVERLSGNSDTLNILVRRDQLDDTAIGPGTRLTVEGEVRSFNNRRANGARLVITVLATKLLSGGDADQNEVTLLGTLCKPPNLRTTPMGREICDLMLAVNRHYGRSDYLPCICWGVNARKAAAWDTGTRLRIKGRLQSRDYIKLTEEGAVKRTAFEISAAEVSRFASLES